MITPAEVEEMIREALPGGRVEVLDTTGMGDHFLVSVESEAFRGRSLVEQHRMVFSALEKEMDKRIHAVQLKTRVPAS